MEFEDFIRRFIEAIRKGDTVFLEGVYQDWFSSSGIMPGASVDDFLRMARSDLEPVGMSSFMGSECFGGFCVAQMKGADGSVFSLCFRKKGNSWEFFNERTGLSSFKKIYAMGYLVEGEGRLSVRFNGAESPVLRDIGSSGFVSMINSALRVGKNELALVNSGKPVRVSIRISSGKEGTVMDSTQGDVLSWEGVVDKAASLGFSAE